MRTGRHGRTRWNRGMGGTLGLVDKWAQVDTGDTLGHMGTGDTHWDRGDMGTQASLRLVDIWTQASHSGLRTHTWCDLNLRCSGGGA